LTSSFWASSLWAAVFVESLKKSASRECFILKGTGAGVVHSERFNISHSFLSFLFSSFLLNGGQHRTTACFERLLQLPRPLLSFANHWSLVYVIIVRLRSAPTGFDRIPPGHASIDQLLQLPLSSNARAATSVCVCDSVDAPRRDGECRPASIIRLFSVLAGHLMIRIYRISNFLIIDCFFSDLDSLRFFL
jgi:hypothetical protein